MEEIKAGDVVILKSENLILDSNKTLMTVSFVRNDGDAHCLWFVNGELHKANIDVNALMKA